MKIEIQGDVIIHVHENPGSGKSAGPADVVPVNDETETGPEEFDPEKDEYICPYCDTAFPTPSGALNHVGKCDKKEDKEIEWRCDICGSVHPSLKPMSVHITKTHGKKGMGISAEFSTPISPEDERPIADADDSRSICPFCGNDCNSAEGVYQHTRHHHADKLEKAMWTCNKCGENKDNLRGMGLHLSQSHGLSGRGVSYEFATPFLPKEETVPDSDLEDVDPRRICPFCNRVLNAGSVSEHINNSHPDLLEKAEWECNECGIRKSNLKGIAGHLAKKHGFEGKGVGWAFSTPVLPDTRKYAKAVGCGECGLSFPDKDSLETHREKAHRSSEE